MTDTNKLKCDNCDKTKNDVQLRRDGADRTVDEDSIRDWIKDNTGKDITWIPKLCEGCLHKWKLSHYN